MQKIFAAVGAAVVVTMIHQEHDGTVNIRVAGDVEAFNRL
jgi:hypothetical protein